MNKGLELLTLILKIVFIKGNNRSIFCKSFAQNVYIINKLTSFLLFYVFYFMFKFEPNKVLFFSSCRQL